MMAQTFSAITREKHMDHMVRVVPLIVAAYAIQCYFIMQMGPIEFAVDALMVMGGMLVCMIAGFVTYDLTHVVKFSETHVSITIGWIGYTKTFSYEDVMQVEVSDPGQSFATLKLITKSGKKYGFYFVDDADKIKAWLEQKRVPAMSQAA